jgi:hypothetical protein
MLNCPQCHSERIHQARRRGVLERKVLAMIFIRPFRCERCDCRFLRWSVTTTPNACRQPTAY